jgi:hypothetical protein
MRHSAENIDFELPEPHDIYVGKAMLSVEACWIKSWRIMFVDTVTSYVWCTQLVVWNSLLSEAENAIVHTGRSAECRWEGSSSFCLAVSWHSQLPHMDVCWCSFIQLFSSCHRALCCCTYMSTVFPVMHAVSESVFHRFVFTNTCPTPVLAKFQPLQYMWISVKSVN